MPILRRIRFSESRIVRADRGVGTFAFRADLGHRGLKLANLGLHLSYLSTHLGHLGLKLGDLRLKLADFGLQLGNPRLKLGNLRAHLGDLGAQLSHLPAHLVDLALQLVDPQSQQATHGQEAGRQRQQSPQPFPYRHSVFSFILLPPFGRSMPSTLWVVRPRSGRRHGSAALAEKITARETRPTRAGNPRRGTRYCLAVGRLQIAACHDSREVSVEDSVAVDAKRILLRYGAPIAALDSVPDKERIALAREIAKTPLPQREARLREMLVKAGHIQAVD